MAWLLLFPFLLLRLAHAQQPPECQTSCGDVHIPYPFGIGSNCALSKIFELNCTTSPNNGSYTTYKPFFSNVEVLNISLPLAQVRVKNHISWQCYNITTKNITWDDWHLNLSGTPFRLSNSQNKFIAIGSETLAYVFLKESTSIWFRTGCVSVCLSEEGLVNGSCSGIGCCQTAIPSGMNYYTVRFDKNFNNSDVSNFSRCSFAVLMEENGFQFSTSYVKTLDFYYDNNGQVPVILDWAINNNTCSTAQLDTRSYACVSNNSKCNDSTNGPGYFCACKDGYEGNPYLVDGCKGKILHSFLYT